MSKLVSPFGNVALRTLMVVDADLSEERGRAETLQHVPMTSRETSDVVMMGIGAYSPISGFMGHDDWYSVCNEMQMASGLFWPIPITLSCSSTKAESINVGEEVTLVDSDSSTIMAILEVKEKYTIDKAFECSSVFQTENAEHPGVQKVMEQNSVNLAGQVRVLSEGTFPEIYKDLYLRPADTRALFEEKGWSTIAAFQTRNPMHRSHEYLAKVAVEIFDGLLIHQVLGKLKSGDIPADIRTRSINALVENYFVPGTVIQAGYPIEMRYAGPREALFHALFRQNFGCSHLVIGRDHAGVGDYYGPYDAQQIFDTIPAGSLETKPLKIDVTFYCYRCGGVSTARTCPHKESDRLNISGTRLREMFANHEQVPSEFSRPEVLKVLQSYYDSLN